MGLVDYTKLTRVSCPNKNFGTVYESHPRTGSAEQYHQRAAHKFL